MIPVESVLDRLEGVRRSGRGWTARCPSHEDRLPSLSVSEGDDGRALVHCHAGCTADEVVRALRLELRDLFLPKNDTRERLTRARRGRQTRRAVMPRSVAEVLVESGEFARHWEAAKALARLEQRVMRQDVIASWDYLTERFNVPALLQLAYLIRGVAFLRHCDARNARDPATVARAIDRLLEEIRMTNDEAMRHLENAGVMAEEDGARLLDDVHAALTRYVVFPSPAAAGAVTLYVAATHAQPAWEHASRLVFTSPLKRCGKSRAQECVAVMAHRVIKTTNISVAALVRSIDEDDPPTLILDEGDSVFAKRRGERSEGAEDLLGVLNAGHARDWPYIRWDAAARRSEACSTFAMAVIGAIGSLPDTIEDRAVMVRMRRRAPTEPIAQWRRRRAVPELEKIRARLHTWVQARLHVLEQMERPCPWRTVPPMSGSRWSASLTWPGGDWSDRARQACEVLESEGDMDEATAGERLLSDLRGIFDDSDKLATATNLERLHEIEEAPWGDWYGHALNARDLERLLRPWGIKSKNVRLGAVTPKGYERAAFQDAWGRYVDTPPSQAPQAPQMIETADEARGGRVADTEASSATRDDQGKQIDVAGVAGVADVGPTRSCDFDGCIDSPKWPTYWGAVYCKPHFRQVAAEHDANGSWPERESVGL